MKIDEYAQSFLDRMADDLKRMGKYGDTVACYCRIDDLECLSKATRDAYLAMKDSLSPKAIDWIRKYGGKE